MIIILVLVIWVLIGECIKAFLSEPTNLKQWIIFKILNAPSFVFAIPFVFLYAVILKIYYGRSSIKDEFLSLIFSDIRR